MRNFQKPTLKELRDRAISSINICIKGADAFLRRRFLNIIATILAGIGDEILRYLDYLLKQIFIEDADEKYLIKHGKKHKFPRKIASKASGVVIFPGNEGSLISKGTKFKRSDNILYTSAADSIVEKNGYAEIEVIADNAGKDGNAAAGTIISLLSPVAGLNMRGSVDQNGLSGGSDIEDIEEYRSRLIEHLQNPAIGGATKDYEIWAKEVPGVTRAWCSSQESGDGTVTVRFMMDNIYEDGIPQTADIFKVKEYLDSKRPATAKVIVTVPVLDNIDFVFSKLMPLTAMPAVSANLKEFIRSSSVKPGQTILIHRIRTAISLSPGLTNFELQEPTADIIMAPGHLPALGNINVISEENNESRRL